MHQFLTELLTLGMMASVMATVVLGIRTCFGRMPKVYTYILWIFVFIRAILPVSYSSAFSLWTLLENSRTQSPPTGIVRMAEPDCLPAPDTYGVSDLPQNALPESRHSLKSQAPDPAAAAGILWAAGCSSMLLYSLFVLIRLRRTVRFSVRDQAYSQKYGCLVYESDQIRTAFLLGFFCPSVYLPAGLSDAQKHLILEHESTHIRRHDHQIKTAAWLILSLYWFLPPLWIGFYFLDKDMELSCDERVLKNLGTRIRSDYGSLLLNFATQDHVPKMPISFCSSSPKTRIRHIMRYRPQKTCSAVFAILLVSVTLYGCMSGPQENPPAKEALLTETISSEMPSDDSKIPESEELAFAKKFVSAVAEASTNISADDIYEMLSPGLKADAGSLSALNIQRLDLDTDHYITIHGPFIPGEPVITAESDHIFLYRMTPVNLEPDTFCPEYDKDCIWKGKIQVEQNADGSFQVAQWENSVIDPITSRRKCMSYYPDSRLQVIGESIPSREEWKQLCLYDSAKSSYDDTFGDHRAYFENCLNLLGGKITDITTDDAAQEKQITYTWEDGAIIFYMAYRAEDDIWIPFRSVPKKW